jgi:hypothetical protein
VTWSFYGASDVGIETMAAAALTVTRELHFWTIRRRRINYTPQLEQFINQFTKDKHVVRIWEAIQI